jgi:hypothetical protein
VYFMDAGTRDFFLSRVERSAPLPDRLAEQQSAGQ